MYFIRALILCLLLIVTSPYVSRAETIYVSVAASMTDAVKEVISTFPLKNKKDRVLANFASSGSLAKQISQGAPAHLYISANPKWMDFLIKSKDIAPDTKKTLAYNSLVFIGDPDNTVTELSQIKKLKRIAIGSPGSVPAGQYAKQAMEAAGVYEFLKNSNILVMAKDVRQALIYADQGEVEGAFVYKTDARLAQKTAILFTIPTELYSRVAYPIALTTEGAKSALAGDFFQHVLSKKGAEILAKYGFEPVR